MQENELRIRVDTDNPAEARKYAVELHNAIRDAVPPEIQLAYVRDNPESQDLGTVLQLITTQMPGVFSMEGVHHLVHGTAFTLETIHALVAALMIWKEWRRERPLIVETPAGELRVEGSAPIEQIVQQIHALLAGQAAKQPETREPGKKK